MTHHESSRMFVLSIKCVKRTVFEFCDLQITREGQPRSKITTDLENALVVSN